MNSLKTATVLVCVINFFPIKAAAEEIEKKIWLSNFRVSFVAYTCQKKQRFRRCFEVEKEECEDMMLTVLDLCLKTAELEIPETIKLPGEGRKIGESIGSCAGRAYETVFYDKKVEPPQCDLEDVDYE